MSEIIFEVREDEVDGGFVATALGHGIATQGETAGELRGMVRDAVRCHFGDGVPGPMPSIIRLKPCLRGPKARKQASPAPWVSRQEKAKP